MGELQCKAIGFERDVPRYRVEERQADREPGQGEDEYRSWKRRPTEKVREPEAPSKSSDGSSGTA